MKVIAFHSYKGGTGKTHLSCNLAAALAKKGYKTCLLDFDFRGPNAHTLFDITPHFTINDYLSNPQLTATDILVKVSSSKFNVPLYAAFASTDFRKIGEIVRADKLQRQQNLKRILRLREELKNDGFDFVILDTAPGVQLESIDGLVISDIVILVMKIDDFDFRGTKSMVSQLYSLLDAQNYVVVNRVVGMPTPETLGGGWTTEDITMVKEFSKKVKEEIGMEVIKGIPCFCSVARAYSRSLFVLEQPEHPFSMALLDLADVLLRKDK